MEPGNKVEAPHRRDRRKTSPGVSASINRRRKSLAIFAGDQIRHQNRHQLLNFFFLRKERGGGGGGIEYIPPRRTEKAERAENNPGYSLASNKSTE